MNLSGPAVELESHLRVLVDSGVLSTETLTGLQERLSMRERARRNLNTSRRRGRRTTSVGGTASHGEERPGSDGADHVVEHCHGGRLAAPRKEHVFELDLEWAPGNLKVVFRVCRTLTGSRAARRAH
jgi:hypothetical protein